MDEIAVDENLKLRLLNLEFAEEAFAAVERNRELLKVWLPWVRSTTAISDELAYFSTSLGRCSQGRCMEMGIFRCDDAGSWKFVGMCGLVQIFHNTKAPGSAYAEIGYWLDQDHHGKGIVTKCCGKLIKAAFTDLHMDMLKIMANKNNGESIAVAHRLGFQLTEEKLLKPHPIFHESPADVLIFALTRQEWVKERSVSCQS